MRAYSLLACLAIIIVISGCIQPGPPGQNSNQMPPPGTPGQNPYGPEQPGQNPGIGGFNLPPHVGDSQPLDKPPVRIEEKKLILGNIEILYNNVAPSYSPLTMGTDLLIAVRNTGSQDETVHMTPIRQLRTGIPNWCMHFFALHPDDVTVKAGEERTLHYFASNDGQGEFNISIDFWTTNPSDKVTADVEFYNGMMDHRNMRNDAVVYGYVRDRATNQPIAANVDFSMFSGREGFRSSSDASGRYVIPMPSYDEIVSLFGSQKVYDFSNFVTVSADGYEYFYQGGIAPKHNETLRLDIYLDPKTPTRPYKLDWESKVSDYYGFFWVLADISWRYVVASQAKHTPALDKPTNFYLFDANTGTQLWKYPTSNECWGIDITRDGSLVAAGCSDGSTYVVNTADGSLKWAKNGTTMNREVEFSHDGRYLVTGPLEGQNAGLFSSSDGSLLKGLASLPQESLRNAKFTNGDNAFVVGLSFGYTAMFDTATGSRIWENYIGEFPLFLAIDSKANTYAAGKSRTMFSFDPAGRVRWSFRVPDHTAGTGAITPDGSKVAIGTVGGWLYYLDGNTGNVLWKRKLPCVNAGHNAVSMSADGNTVAVGCAPEYILSVYNAHGTLIYSYQSQENPDPILNSKWATIGPEASDGTQKGIMGTYTSTDGSKIVAGYGDDYVRGFEAG